MTVVKKQYDSYFPTSSNYMPMPFAAGWRRTRGNEKSGKMTVIGGQALGACGFKEDLVEVMVSRSLSGDDEKGMGEALVEERSTSVLLAVLLGEERGRDGQGGGFGKSRDVGSSNFRKAVIVVGSGIEGGSGRCTHYHWGARERKVKPCIYNVGL